MMVMMMIDCEEHQLIVVSDCFRSLITMSQAWRNLPTMVDARTFVAQFTRNVGIEPKNSL